MFSLLCFGVSGCVPGGGLELFRRVILSGGLPPYNLVPRVSHVPALLGRERIDPGNEVGLPQRDLFSERKSHFLNLSGLM